MSTDRAHLLRQPVVARKQRPAVAVTAQRFGRKEARAADERHPATAPSALGRAKALGPVFDHGEPVPQGDGVDAVVVGHLPKEAHRDNGPRAGRNRLLEQPWVEIVAVRFDVHEHRFGAHQADRLGGADPGERNGDDLVARSDPQGAQGDLEGVRAAGHRKAVFDSDIPPQHPLQFGNLGAQNELAVVEDRSQAGINFRLIPPVLRLQVNESHEADAARRKTRLRPRRFAAPFPARSPTLLRLDPLASHDGPPWGRLSLFGPLR